MSKIKIVLTLLSFSVLTACGGGGGDNTTPTEDNKDPTVVNETTSSNEVLDSLKVLMNDKEGTFVQGSIPFSDASTSPVISSAPDTVKTNALSKERVDLVYEVDSSIEEIYFTVANADGYVAFSKEQAFSALATSSPQTESVSLIVEISDLIDNTDFCARVSVKSENQTLSDLTEVCFSVNEQNDDNRVIYFADYSSNSTLSTLNFDTGEVINIGSTGYQLSDIAFYKEELYGVTMSQLISIDIATGKGTVIGDIGVFGVNALEGASDVLFAGSVGGEFLSIDPRTGAGMVIGFFGSGTTSSGDLVFNEGNDFLYGSLEVQGSTTDTIASINPNTGLTEFIGDTGFNEVWGLALFRSQLLGLTTNGELIIIDRDNGKGTLIENTDSFDAGGAAAVKN